MTVLSVNGFEAERSQASFERRYPDLTTNLPLTWPNEAGRFGGYCLRHDVAGLPLRFREAFTSPGIDLCVRFALRASKPFTPSSVFIVSKNNGASDVSQIELRFFAPDASNPDGYRLAVVRGGVATLDVARWFGDPLEFLPGRWYDIQIRLKIGDTAGEWEMRVDGMTVTSGTGNTQGADPETGWDKILFSLNPLASGYVDIDDLSVVNPTGETNDGFLERGDWAVETLFPKDRGHFNEWDPQPPPPGHLHWEHVDDARGGDVDDDATYVYSEDIQAVDSFVYDQLKVVDGMIRGLLLQCDARNESGGTTQVSQPVVRDGAVLSPVFRSLASTDYVFLRQTHSTDPFSGVGWSKARVNSAQYGLAYTAAS